MAVDYLKQKLNTVSRTQELAIQLLEIISEATQLRQEAIDNGFNPGGANGITDSNLQDPTSPGLPAPFPHLAATDLTAAFAAFAAIDTTLAASSRTHYKALTRLRP